MLAFSLSPSRIWLSRSTSKTDALDDDETPLRLTVSHSDHKAVVSGIMGGLDTAATLHFVELGLKINGEKWITVMDEFTVPMRPPHAAWTLLDTAPSHARRLASLHGTAEFQPPCSPDLSPLDFFVVDRAQNTARSACSSCQSRRTAGTFDPRVPWDVERQPLDVREGWQGMGSQAKGLRCHQRLFLNSTGIADRIVPLKDTAQITSSTRVRHSAAPSTDTDSTTDTDNTPTRVEWSPPHAPNLKCWAPIFMVEKRKRALWPRLF